jgi:hypothetical protein
MPKLMMRNGDFMNVRCEKCGSFVLKNLWGQRWCWSSKCGWFDDTITTDYPLPKDEETKTEKPKKVVKRKKK